MRRTVGQLLSADDAWPDVLRWVDGAVRPVELLPADPSTGEATLFALQVTTRAPLGALALRSGGILIDGGWLRVLGAGHPRIGRGLREWNGLSGHRSPDPRLANAFVVAYDALGGFYVLNGGAWPGSPGGVHYLAPDAWDRQPLDLTYSGLLQFFMLGDLDTFYADLRWPRWEADVAALGPDETISIYPWLGFESMPIEQRARTRVPVDEAWTRFWTLGPQLRSVPPGASVQVRAADGVIKVTRHSDEPSRGRS